MNSFRFIRWFGVMMFGVMLAATVVAQDGVCEMADNEDLISTVDEVCVEIGENQVCYGNDNVRATPRDNVQKLEFQAPGDNANVVDVQSLSLSALAQDAENPAITRWGIAKMRLLSVSSSGSEEVSMLLFGDVSIEDQSNAGDSINVVATNGANIRNVPSAVNSTVIGSVASGMTLEAVGRLEDTSWLRVRLADGETVGWVFTDLVQPATDDDTYEILAVQDAQSDYYGPMQAFTYRSGSSCADRVTDGMFIQTPEGYARVTMLVNGVNIDLRGSANGATAFVSANSDRGMNVSMLDGAAYVASGGQEYYVDTYEETTIPMSETMTATGAPSVPQPTDTEQLQGSSLLSSIRDPNLPWLPPTSEQVSPTATTGATTTTTTTTNTTTNNNNDDGGGGGGQNFGCERGNSCNAPGRNK